MRWFRGNLYAIIILVLTSPLNAFAQTSSLSVSHVLISEVQTTGAGGATDQEFVEIFNPTAETVDLTNWKLQYSSSTGTSWSSKVTLSGQLYPGGIILMASNNYLTEDSDFSFTPGLKMEAGHVRLIKPIDSNGASEVVDLLGWGTAAHPESISADYAPAGSSMERKGVTDHNYIDSDNNREDFYINSAPNPESENIEPVVVVDQGSGSTLPPEQNDPFIDPDPDATTDSNTNSDNNATNPTDSPQDSKQQPGQDNSNEGDTTNQTSTYTSQPGNTEQNNNPDTNEVTTNAPNADYPNVIISELLPNPGAPLNDDSDEFVELYNPNNFVVTLHDYVVQTGNNYSYSYTIDSLIMSPNSYTVLYSKDSSLVLANSGGRARILDPSGDIVFETESYNDAKDNQSWVYIDGQWSWSNQSTPGFINKALLVVPILKSEKKTAAKKKALSKKVSTAKAPKKSLSTKAKAATKKKAAAKKASNKKSNNNKALGAVGSTDSGGSGSNLQPWIIAGIGALAVGYAIYEYKDDLANKIRQYKQDHRLRAKNRSAA